MPLYTTTPGDIYDALEQTNLARDYWEKCLALNYKDREEVLQKLKEID